jgi:hypothetical protein
MLRMSPDDYQNLQQRIVTATQQRRPLGEQRVAVKNKYGAIATVVDGQRFDSKSEAKRFCQLQIMERAGQISDLKTQVSFELLPAQEIAGKKERAVKYIADFQYMKKGQLVIEDVKSAPTKTKEFVIKRKLMMFIHKAVVREVLMD